MWQGGNYLLGLGRLPTQTERFENIVAFGLAKVAKTRQRFFGGENVILFVSGGNELPLTATKPAKAGTTNGVMNSSPVSLIEMFWQQSHFCVDVGF